METSIINGQNSYFEMPTGEKRKAMVTRLGKILRKIRIDRDELLKDMADKLNMSPSMLSSIENGVRKAPNDFLQRIENSYSLTREERDDIESALSDDWGAIRIPLDDVKDSDKKLALTFARSFTRINDSDKQRILDIVSKEE